MNVQELSSRLKPLFESLKQTQHLITRLSKLPPSLGASGLGFEEGNARVELSAEIHQNLKEQEEDFELLRQEVEDQPNSLGWSSSNRRRYSGRDREKTALAAQITRLGEDLKIARTQFRKAQLQAKKNAETAKQKERESLFSGIQEGNNTTGYRRRKGQEKSSQEELLLNASSDVTAALRRTHNLMITELDRSQFARETLENSTKDLATLSESYNKLDSLLSSSHSLVSTLIHSQKSDTWYLESAFYVLTVTIGWLVFRRLIYGPSWWLLYLPTKWLWRLTLFIFQILIGTLSGAAGAVGAKSQSIALSQGSASISTSLEHKRTGAGSIPKFSLGQAAPLVRAGGGGHGAKMQQSSEQSPMISSKEGPEQTEHRSLSDQVAKMAEESHHKGTMTSTKTTMEPSVDANPETLDETVPDSQEQEAQSTVLRERTAEDGPPNPKKRMWEEAIEPSDNGHPKNEL